MSNEPVAWAREDGVIAFHKQKEVDSQGYKWQPLYTHPINPKYDPETGEPLIDGYPLFSGLPHLVKELTDGQIMQVWWDANDITDDDTVIEFARAILRKAQEK